MTLTPQFGIFLVPMANNPDELFQQAKIADHNGLDLLCSFRIIATPAAFLRDLDAADRPGNEN